MWKVSRWREALPCGHTFTNKADAVAYAKMLVRLHKNSVFVGNESRVLFKYTPTKFGGVHRLLAFKET